MVYTARLSIAYIISRRLDRSFVALHAPLSGRTDAGGGRQLRSSAANLRRQLPQLRRAVAPWPSV